MLQDDDLLHNYTVAKCTENINWDDPELETIEHNGQTYKVYLMTSLPLWLTNGRALMS